MATKKPIPLNKIQQTIADTGHLRWIYPRGKFYWFVGGATDNPELLEKMRYRLLRDMHAVGSAAVRRGRQPVALVTATQVQPLLLRMVRSMQGWKKIVLGEGSLGFDADEVNRLCLNTADVIIVYGTASDSLNTALDGMEHRPEIFHRTISGEGRITQTLVSPNGTDEPYSRFRADEKRLTRVRRIPAKGLQVRDEIDMRPKMDV